MFISTESTHFMEPVPDYAVRHSFQLRSDWKIDRRLLNAEAQRIDIYISHVGSRLNCPQSGETGTLYDHCMERSWRHVDWFQF